MTEILLFVEDAAQEKFLKPLILRMAKEEGCHFHVRPRSVTGGFPKVLGEIEKLAQSYQKGMVSLPDKILVCIDANCQGYGVRKKALDQKAGVLKDFLIHAIPDPHIERWYLLDSGAFKLALGKGCKAPTEKCEKDRYKRLLNEAVTEANVEPLLGGIEYAGDIIDAYDIQRVASQEASFGHFINEFRSWLNQLRSEIKEQGARSGNKT